MTSPVNFVDPTGHKAVHDSGGGSSVPYQPIVSDPEPELGLGSSSNADNGSSTSNDVAKASAAALVGFGLVEDFWYNNNYWCIMDGPYPFADIAFMIGAAGTSLYALGEYIAYAVSNSDSISNAINNFGGGNAAMPPGDPENGFRSFRLLKKYLGSAGEGNEWHHIVEKNQINRSGFSPYDIHNIIKLDKATHGKISAYYSSIDHNVSETMTVRKYLAGQSFSEQYQFGIDVLKKFGVNIP